MDLKGKNGAVTGGASGIGKSLTEEMLKSGLSKVAIFDIDTKTGEEHAKYLNNHYGKDRALFVRCDVSNMADYEQAFITVMDAFKSIEILANNAGIFIVDQPDRVVAVNLLGVINGVTLGMKYMGKDNGGNGGVIVNTGSIAGLDVLSLCTIYAGTKSAVIQMTRYWAQPYYYNKTGIRFLAICPSLMATPLIDCFLNTKSVNEEADALKELISTFDAGKTEILAQEILKVVKESDNGSVWVYNPGEEIFEVTIPTINQMRKNKI